MGLFGVCRKGTITFTTILRQLIRDDGKIESGFE